MRFHSMRTKMLVLVTVILTVFFFSMFSLFTSRSYSLYREQLLANESRMLDKLAESVNYKILNIRWLALDVVLDEDIQSLLRHVGSRSERESYRELYRINELLKRYDVSRGITYGMFIIRRDGGFSSTDESLESFLPAEIGRSWYRDYLASPAVDSPVGYFSSIVSYPESLSRYYQNMICYIRPIMDVREPSTKLGTLVINVDSKAFASVFNGLDVEPAFFSLRNGAGAPIIVSGAAPVAEPPSDAAPLSMKFGAAVYETREDFFFTRAGLENGWSIVERTSKARINKKVIAEMEPLLIIPVASLVLACLMVGATVLRLTAAITRLRDAFQRLAGGDLHLQIDVRSHDEMGELAASFNSLVTGMRELIGTVQAKEKEKQDYKMRALIMQINPHFINNTLSSVIALSRKGRNGDIIALVTAFTAMLQGMIYTRGDLASVVDEITYLQDYERILRIRYGESLAMSFSVQEGCEECAVPRMVLQPLVENALFHGLLPKEAPGLIVVSISREGEAVRVEVRDDGVGMDGQVFARALLRPEDERGGRIGLRNVNDRIRLLYPGNAGLSARGAPGHGTVVGFSIPFSLMGGGELTREEREC